MSMRNVDLQTLLPRAQEASRAQEAGQRQGQMQAAAAAAEQHRQRVEAATRQVREVERPDHHRVRDATDEERQRRRRAEQPPSPRRSVRRGGGPEQDRKAPPAGMTPPGLGQHVDVRA